MDLPQPPFRQERSDAEWEQAALDSWGHEHSPDPAEEWKFWDPELDAARFAISTSAEEYVAARSFRDDVLVDWERVVQQVVRWQGVQTEILARAFDAAVRLSGSGDPTMELRSLAAELACAVGMSDRTLEQHMNDAVALRDDFPATYALLREGTLSRAHAQVVADEGMRIHDDALRAEYEREVLARREALTTSRLRVVARSIAEDLMPVGIDERHAQAREERRVMVREAHDGMAELWALLPAPLAYGIYDRLTQMARIVKRGDPAVLAAGQPSAGSDTASALGDAGDAAGRALEPSGEGAAATPATAPTRTLDGDRASEAGDADAEPVDTRTLDQLRADVLCDVLLTGHSTAADAARDGGDGVDAIRATVQITVPALSLIGASPNAQANGVPDGSDAAGCARMRGGVPIDLETARRLVGAASMWERVLTDPVSGDVVAVDRRFPTEAQRRFLRARDEHCRFPGCRAPVSRCDADHTVDFQYGGATESENLAHLCRRHHTLKGTTAWKVRQRPGGVLEWTSPRDRTYVDRPPPVVRHRAGVEFV